MKKKILAVIICFTMVSSVLIGCGPTSETFQTSEVGTEVTEETEAPGETAEKEEGTVKTYAIVPKSAGNPYNEKEVEGFVRIIEANGGKAVVNYPEEATADAQISVINSLISQGVDSIAVAANDANALQAVLMDAMEAGIKVSTVDSDAAADSRMTFANQAGVKQIGQALSDAVWDIAGGEGQWAIVSATSQATNQNSWIDAMKEIMGSDSKYSKLELVDIQYGDDEPELSTTVT